MQADGEIIDKSLISDPGSWNLALRPVPGSLGIALFPERRDVAPQWREIEIAPSVRLHDVVYAHPVLLGDFRSVTVMLDAVRFLFLPPGVTDQEDMASLMEAAYPGSGLEVVAVAAGRGVMAMGVEPELIAFLRRTFVNLSVMNPLASLIRYFAGRGGRGGNGEHLYASFRERRMDLAVLDGANILMANSYDVNSPDDGAYYVMAALDALRLDPMTTEVSFTGLSADRTRAVSMLRPYLGRIMPVILPAMMGDGADSLPFDLKIMPLCE